MEVPAPQVEGRKDTPSHRRLDDIDAEFSDLYKQFSKRIYYICLRMLGDPTLAEDAAHDVFLKAWQAFSTFKGRSSPGTWLYRIAVNHCKNLLRSWYVHPVSIEDEALHETLAADVTGPFRVVELKELGERIQKALDKLPTEYRLLLLLAAVGELSYEEIASLTNQSVDAVRGKLYRARRAFSIEFKKTEK